MQQMIRTAIWALDRMIPHSSSAEPCAYDVFPIERQSVSFDLVFIHGLGGDPFFTWYQPEERAYWPRWLGEDLGVARVLSVGYPTALSSLSPNHALAFEERASTLFQELDSIGIGSRPVVFIAHSLGGVILKSMLCYCHDRAETLWQVPFGIIFFATPHSGSLLANFAKVFRPFFTKEVSQLRKKAWGELDILNERFFQLCHQREEDSLLGLHAFYEQIPLQVIKSLVVEKRSATRGFLGFEALPGDHFTICKPSSRDNISYSRTLKIIGDWTGDLELAGESKARLGYILPQPQVKLPVDFTSSGMSRRQAISVVGAGLAGGALGAGSYAYILGDRRVGGVGDPREELPSFGNQKPSVIGVYPSDSFGVDCSQGLSLGLAPYSDLATLTELNTLPIQDMKAGKIESLIAELRRAVDRDNVVAVVGPPISEITFRVATALGNSPRRIPLFIASAISSYGADWRERRESLPLYRLSSGIGTRAEQLLPLAEFAKQLGWKTTFLVETPASAGEPETFGQKFAREIRGHLSKHDLDFQSVKFNTAQIQDSFLELETYIRNRKNLVFVLGLSYHLTSLVKRFYVGATSDEVAVIGGWMNAYRLEGILRDTHYPENKIFDISDFSGLDGDGQLQERFRQAFGKVASPAQRDRAFFYDVGRLLGENLRLQGVVQDGKYLEFNAKAILAFDHRIATTRKKGITGDIEFSALGTNLRQRLGFYRYQQQGSNRAWKQLPGFWSLFEREDLNAVF